MKVLLINPPLYSPHFIYGAVPVLLGQLKGNNIQADALDLNYEFLYDVLSPDYLKKTLVKLKKIYFLNKCHGIIKIHNFNGKYCLSQQQINKQNKLIKEVLFNKERKYKKIINNAQKVFKLLPENPKEEYIKISDIALSLAFLPYYPSIIKVSTNQNSDFMEINPLYNFTYEDIINRCSNNQRNIL